MTVARSRIEQQAQDDLAAALAAIRSLLEAGTGRKVASLLPEPVPGSPLERVSNAFGLTTFERGVLLLSTAIELHPGIDALCADLNGSAQQPWPTFALAMSVLPGADWRALLPTGPLRAHRLIGLGAGDVLTDRQISIEERVLHALMGHDYLDSHLGTLLSPVHPNAALPASHASAALRLASVWETGNVHLWCEEPGAAKAVAAAAAAVGSRRLMRLAARDAPSDPEHADEFIALWSREARLHTLALFVDLDATGEGSASQAARDIASRAEGAVVSGGRDPRAGEPIQRLRIRPAPFEERLAHWRDAIGELPQPKRLEEVVARFQLDADGIDAAVEALRDELKRDPEADAARVLWRSARTQAHPNLEDLAQRIPLVATWKRLVLPEGPARMLKALLGQARCKATVDHAWGFAERGARANGSSAVFAGPSGTGKTMAAEVIAGELDLELYRIDLSAVVSKYIGETEKNLRRVFDAAEAGGAVLLFDEADALFGKRTEVKDSHDRHANIEVSYLLQRMESYGGLAILTTNYRQHLDEAFLRRIPFIIEFPFPDAELRERIWRAIFPLQTPLESLDYARLARLSIAGGGIRSIARNAAFLAADAGCPINMALLKEAAHIEYQKLNRTLTPSEVRGWT